jgi:beta-lactamase regulating signal transducer with metallopeptidase domain
MIRFIFVCLFVFSVILNILFVYENQRLNEEVQRHFFKRLDLEFKKNHPEIDYKIKKQYPILV